MEYNRGCCDCRDCKGMIANGEINGFWFYGCFHKPYKGKWIAEIKECPKTNKNN